MHPREYLSWSSLDLFERSRERWIALYIKDEKLKFNAKGQAGIDLGRKMADCIENDEKTGDLVFDLTVASIPRLDESERLITATIKRRGKEPVPLLGYLDNAKRDLSAFIEYKQGRTAWTQKKVDNHDQLTFYATIIYLLTKKIPTMSLVWVPTEETAQGKVTVNEMTGEVKTFKTTRSLVQILRMMSRMGNSWDEIEKVTNEKMI